MTHSQPCPRGGSGRYTNAATFISHYTAHQRPGCLFPVQIYRYKYTLSTRMAYRPCLCSDWSLKHVSSSVECLDVIKGYTAEEM